MNKEEQVKCIKVDKEFMEGIRKGVKDCKAGKVRLWSDIRKELGI